MEPSTLHQYKKKRLVNKIRTTVKKLLTKTSDKHDIIVGLKKLSNSKDNWPIRIFWLLVVTFCFLTCVYQITRRIIYYWNEPTVVDVRNEEVTEGDLPMINLCTRDTKDMLDFMKTRPAIHRPLCYTDMVGFLTFENVGVDKIWNLINTSKIIKDAYLVLNKQVNVTLQQRNIQIIAGCCTQIFHDDTVSFRDPALKMRIALDYPELNDPACSSPLMAVAIQSKDKKILDASPLISISVIANKEVIVSAQQYIFKHTAKKPCVGVQEYEICEEQCLQETYHKHITGCRFPFMTADSQREYCKTSNEISKIYSKTMFHFFLQNPRVQCKCPRICHQTFFNNLVVTNELRHQVLEISMEHHIIRTMVERFAYDIISLFCDIGGNLGLFMGMSCLSIVDLIIQSMLLWKKSYCSTTLKNNKLQQKVNYILQKQLKKKPNTHTVFNRTTKPSKKYTRWNYNKNFFAVKQLIYYLVTGSAVVLCLYQMCDRIAYYFDYPTIVTVEVVLDEEIQLPAVITCSEIGDIIEEKRRITQIKNNTNCGNVDFLDLLDPPSTYRNNPEKLWLASGVTDKYLKKHTHLIVGNLSSHLTVFGNCTESSTDSMLFMGFRSVLVVLRLDKEHECDCHVTSIIVPPDERLDLKRIMYNPCESKADIKFTRQTIIKLNLPNKPCDKKSKVNSCEEECFKKKLNDLKITCRLPFMTSLTIPFCNNSVSAKMTRRAYFNAYLRTNPSIDCGCRLKCDETIFIPRTSVSEYFGRSVSIYALQNNVREVITQNLAFPAEKLFCDIGSNLGVLLGLSVLSLIELLQHTIGTLVKLIKASEHENCTFAKIAKLFD